MQPPASSTSLGDAEAADQTMRKVLDLCREIGATGHAEHLACEIAA